MLDAAGLAAQGVDFWENQKAHSRVNTLWWADQLKQRKALKRGKTHEYPNSPSVSSSRNYNSALTIFNMSPQKIPKLSSRTSTGFPNTDHIEVRTVTVHSENIDAEEGIDEQSPEDSLTQPGSVIRHGSLSAGIIVPEQSFNLDVPDGDDLHYEETVDEFESLLEDYRSASKQLLNSEIEKRQQMMQLNQQKEVIEGQNKKIQELERQFAIFENTLKETDTLKRTDAATIEDAADVLGKFEDELAAHSESVMRVGVTQQITEVVRGNLSRQYSSKIDEPESVDELRRMLTEKENEIRALRQQLEAKGIVEMELREQLGTLKRESGNVVHSNWALYLWIVMMFWNAHRGS